MESSSAWPARRCEMERWNVHETRQRLSLPGPIRKRFDFARLGRTAPQRSEVREGGALVGCRTFNLWIVGPVRTTGPVLSKVNMETARRPIAIFPRSLGDACPKCRKPMTVTPCEDFEILTCTCGHSCKQQSGEMKLHWSFQVLERTAQKKPDFRSGRSEGL